MIPPGRDATAGPTGGRPRSTPSTSPSTAACPQAGTRPYKISYTEDLTDPNGVNTMQVSDVDGVRLQGLLLDAGTVNSAALLTVGTAGSTVSHASNPISVQDVFFRIGGDIAGKATSSLVVNANDTVVDDIWAWRADHGNGGTVGWTTNTADNGMTVNGNNVEATGLFVEHYQKTEVAWNGQNGKVIFFQNEMPYDLPTVSLGGVGTITHVINNTGAVTPSNTTPSDVVSFP